MQNVTCNHHIFTPSKVVCIGRNYVEHIHELHNEIPESMVVFNKPNSAITDTLIHDQDETRFEAEICFLIQDNRLYGVGVGLDLTRANLQNYLKQKGLPWERAKGFNNSAVLSPFIPLHSSLQSLRMSLHVNDVLRQNATYDLMIYKPDVMLQEIQTFMHLEDGDIIMSGTPKGVGNYHTGERFTCRLYSNETLLLEQEWVVQ